MSTNSFGARAPLERRRGVLRDLPPRRGRRGRAAAVSASRCCWRTCCAPRTARTSPPTTSSALAGWDPTAEPDTEIQFTPARVIMQDFTGVPCVVDLATMREAVVELGGDPAKINPLAPAELVIDHSVIADVFGTPDAFARNVELEYERNQERYQFLRWGQSAFDEFKVVPPGTGIVHQVNIEHLARVVIRDARRDVGLPGHPGRHRLAHHHGQRPRRARLGRRRHRGRGGACSASRSRMLIPRVVGFKLTGELPAGRHRHRPRAHHHRDAAQARRGRQVRRVLRRGRRPPSRWPTGPPSAT